MDIVVKNLTKKFGAQKAVDNISLKVATGEILGFLGPNGAGKTTTMKILTNFISADEGEVYIGGMSLKEDPYEIKKHIGYLPENNPLYQDMAVMDYLEFCALIHGINKNRVNTRVAEMIRITGLNKEKHKKIGELSKGYRQRVGLAQAMIHDPEILILDEPTSGLDPNQIAEIRKLIRELGREKTVILSTHILPEVEATCDRIFIINKGRIVADGTAETLRKQAQGTDIIRVRIEDGDANKVFKSLQALKNVKIVDFADRQMNRFDVHCTTEDVKRQIFRMCVDNKWVMTEMTPLETKLEDIFRELTMN
ncbi:MAG: ATP-binding cassette domain-containing protein [Bacteroidales bacterium]|nr:ATP-binding cassette domain-containing protein [Bacteroidales bacterium]